MSRFLKPPQARVIRLSSAIGLGLVLLLTGCVAGGQGSTARKSSTSEKTPTSTTTTATPPPATGGTTTAPAPGNNTPPPPPVAAARLFSSQIVVNGGVDANYTQGTFALEPETGSMLNAGFVYTYFVIENQRLDGFYTALIINPLNFAGDLADNDARAGIFTMKFNITKPGAYRIWVRKINFANSVYVKLDGGAYEAKALPGSNNYTWALLNQEAAGAVVPYAFNTGVHTLEIRQRNASPAFIEQILITDDAALVPQPTVPRVARNVVDLEWDVSALARAAAGVRVVFKVTASNYDATRYLLTNPRLEVSAGSVLVKNVVIHVNNVANPADIAFTGLDEEIVAPGKAINNGALLNNLQLIVNKGATPALDRFSVSFETLTAR